MRTEQRLIVRVPDDKDYLGKDVTCTVVARKGGTVDVKLYDVNTRYEKDLPLGDPYAGFTLHADAAKALMGALERAVSDLATFMHIKTD